MGWTVIVSEEKGAILRSETTDFIEIFTIAFFLFVCMTITPPALTERLPVQRDEGTPDARKEIEGKRGKIQRTVREYVLAISSRQSIGVA